ncbi:hypothetical protein CFOL_v3_21792 [Cephalotus follicularis]|uniref:Uncharacterized protein n=1 Tax=Cephalotus follicularis TaxID=3775 RepID=A0A1Q3CDK7_CEPFO|nr:hypothetical protein CFOL_v3_21792 [Cephalotus follicularis]
MAVDLHNKELLLPSQFFTEDALSENKQQPINQNWNCAGSFDSLSGFSLQVESETGSTETESSEEEEGYLAELTRQMANYMLQDDNNNKEKVWGSASSPRSMIRSPLSSHHDSNMGPSCEPPSPPAVTSLMLNFERIKIYDEIPSNYTNNDDRHITPPIKATTARNRGLQFHSNQVLADNRIRAIQFSRGKQEQIMKQKETRYWKRQAHVSKKLEPGQKLTHFNNKARSCNGFIYGQKLQLPAMQQQHTDHHQAQAAGSGMRAVFLNGSGSPTGSCGTGVFLPRGIGNPDESHKKSGCSTVLIPARVAHALKLHFDKVGATSRLNGSLIEHDLLMGGRSSLDTQQRSLRRTVAAMNHHQETGLPQEWTY